MTSTDINALFSDAEQDGDISPEAAQVINITDMGGQIQQGLGISVDDVTASEVVLLTQLLDDSSSISSGGNTQVVCDGHNLVLEALEGSNQNDGILAHATTLNSGTLYPYQPIDSHIRLGANYSPRGTTPLYDQAIVALATVIAKAKEFTDNGVACRTVTLIMTDGCDVGSRARPSDVAKVVGDMLRQETHIISAMGINDGHTDFKKVFANMGIQDEWILTPGNTESEIRKAFQVFSQSAVRVSQNADSFSQTAIGGFGQ